MKIVVNGQVFNTEIDAIAIMFDTDEERKQVAANLTSMPDRDGMRQYFTIPDGLGWDAQRKEQEMDENELLARINFDDLSISRHIKTTSTCLEKAGALEPIFVIRAKDPLSPIAVSVWMNLCKHLKLHADKIEGAAEVIQEIYAWREKAGLPMLANPLSELGEELQSERDGCFVLSFDQLPGSRELLNRIYEDYRQKPITGALLREIEMCISNWLCLFIERGEMWNYEGLVVDADMSTGAILPIKGKFHIYAPYAMAWTSGKPMSDAFTSAQLPDITEAFIQQVYEQEGFVVDTLTWPKIRDYVMERANLCDYGIIAKLIEEA